MRQHEWNQTDQLAICRHCGLRVHTGVFDLATFPADCRRPSVQRPPESGQTASGQTAVIVVSHNYGRFLAECLDSVLAQTRPAAEILVIDDASDDDTATVAAGFAQFGVRYLRTENHHVHQNRLDGAAATVAPCLIFLDADDQLPPNYIQAAEAVAGTDPGIGLVFTDCELFGLRSGLHRHDPVNIEQRNYLHCASLVRRAALESVVWPATTTSGYTHNDWYMWRRIVRLGWKTAKSPVPLRYRQHAASMMHVASGRLPYWDYAALDEETVQIVLPLSGRRKWFSRIQRWFAEQTWPQISLLVIDASPDVTFRRDVRDWLAGLTCETTYLPLQSTGELPDRERRNQPETVRAVQRAMPRLYNPAVRRLSQELVFWLEDDILPPVDAIARLARSMDAHVAAVSGAVPSRFEPRVIAWRTPTLETIRAYGDGVERIHGSGFGCLLVRRSFLQAHPLHAGGCSGNYDQEIAFDAARDGLEWRIDWSVQCAHQEIPAGALLASDQI